MVLRDINEDMLICKLSNGKTILSRIQMIMGVYSASFVTGGIVARCCLT